MGLEPVRRRLEPVRRRSVARHLAVETECADAAGDAAVAAYHTEFSGVTGYSESSLSKCECAPPIPADKVVVASTSCEIKVVSTFVQTTDVSAISNAQAAAEVAAENAITTSVSTELAGTQVPCCLTPSHFSHTEHDPVPRTCSGPQPSGGSSSI